MQKAFKYRIYPNKKQQAMLNKTFGCCRFVYNYFLARRQEMYEIHGLTLSYAKCSKEMTALKHSDEYNWLCEADATALQSSLRRLDTAYKNFFEKRADYPRFKKKHDSRCSYTSKNNSDSIRYSYGYITLPKIGAVRSKNRCVPQGRIINATVTKASSGKYFVSLMCEDVDIRPLKKNECSAGIDLGISHFCTLNDGTQISSPKHLESSLKKLAKLQKNLSRKTKGSSNYRKAQIRVARMHEHISSQRNDFLQKTSTQLIREYQTICIEDLDVLHMQKDRHLSRNIADASWSRFADMLTYKAEWYGRTLVKVDRHYASSQLCHACGYKNAEIKDIRIRKWICPECGTVHDRDINAARNILSEGLRILESAL